MDLATASAPTADEVPGTTGVLSPDSVDNDGPQDDVVPWTQQKDGEREDRQPSTYQNFTNAVSRVVPRSMQFYFVRWQARFPSLFQYYMEKPLDFSGYGMDHIKDDSLDYQHSSFYPAEWHVSFKRHPGMYCFNVLYTESMKNPEGAGRNPMLLLIKGELLELINRYLTSSTHCLSDETMSMIFLVGVYEMLCDDLDRAKVYFAAQRAIISQRGGLQALSNPRQRRVKFWGDLFFWHLIGQHDHNQQYARPYRQSWQLINPAHPIRVALDSCNRALSKIHRIHEAFFSIHAPEQHLIGALVRLAKLANAVPPNDQMQAPYVRAEVAGLRELFTNGKFTKVMGGRQEYADLVIESIRHGALLIVEAIGVSLEVKAIEAAEGRELEEDEVPLRPMDALDLTELISDSTILLWVAFAAGAWAQQQIRKKYVELIGHACQRLRAWTWEAIQKALSSILFCKFLVDPYSKLWEEYMAVLNVSS